MQAKQAEQRVQAGQLTLSGGAARNVRPSASYYVSTNTTPATYTSASALTTSPPNLASATGVLYTTN